MCGKDLGDYGDRVAFPVGEEEVDGEVEGGGAPEWEPPLGTSSFSFLLRFWELDLCFPR